jgi:Thymidylate synthase
MSIDTRSISEAWRISLNLFSKTEILNRYDSQRGPCVEVEDLLIRVAEPNESTSISDLYPRVFHPLVESYAEGFFGTLHARNSTVSERLYSWRGSPNSTTPSSDDKPLDQVKRAIDELVSKPESRYNIIGLWNPRVDPSLRNPVSPLLTYFRVRSEKLHSTLIVRTIDAWLGAIPMFVGFARFHRHVAEKSENRAGPISFFILSYHVYEMDLPIVLATSRES